jgi:uncharacterized protein YjlB
MDHSNTHEALGVFSARTSAQFGGPPGVEMELPAGDLAVLPAGTAHMIPGSSPGCGAVRACPPRPANNLCRGDPKERPQTMDNIKRATRPATEPVFGRQAGLCECRPD